MKKTILFFALFAGFSTTQAQNAIKDVSGNYTAVKQAANDTTNATLTGKTFTDEKGNVFPVYLSKRGKMYIIKTAKVSGKVYKMYLKF